MNIIKENIIIRDQLEPVIMKSNCRYIIRSGIFIDLILPEEAQLNDSIEIHGDREYAGFYIHGYKENVDVILKTKEVGNSISFSYIPINDHSWHCSYMIGLFQQKEISTINKENV